MLRAWENPEWDMGQSAMPYSSYGNVGGYPMHGYSPYAHYPYAPYAPPAAYGPPGNTYSAPSYPPYPGAYPSGAPQAQAYPGTHAHAAPAAPASHPTAGDHASTSPAAPPTMPTHPFASQMHGYSPGYGPGPSHPGYPPSAYPQHPAGLALHPYLGFNPQSAAPPPPPPPPPQPPVRGGAANASAFASAAPPHQPEDALARQLQAVMESLQACGINLQGSSHAARGMTASTARLDLHAALKAVELASR
jgi:hypothetical protein